jgi:hypothetical protein
VIRIDRGKNRYKRYRIVEVFEEQVPAAGHHAAMMARIEGGIDRAFAGTYSCQLGHSGKRPRDASGGDPNRTFFEMSRLAGQGRRAGQRWRRD